MKRLISLRPQNETPHPQLLNALHDEATILSILGDLTVAGDGDALSGGEGDSYLGISHPLL